MKALIIGAAGFVGGYLIKQLAGKDGMEVLATKLAHEKLENNGLCKVSTLDILDAESVKSLFREYSPDVVFHLAAQSSVALSWKNPALTVDVNIKGTLNVLEALKELKGKARLLLIGSGEEYGTAVSGDKPINEENMVRPGNIYAVTKASQNMLGHVYAKAYGLDIISVRAFNHIGAGQADTFVAANFCKQAVEIEKGMKENVLYVGNLSAKRDFTDVRDVVRAYSVLARIGKSGETYNVGSGKAIAIQEILDMILSKSSANITVKQDPDRMRPSDIPVICADISKITADTGWIPSIPLDQTISDMLSYWRKTV